MLVLLSPACVPVSVQMEPAVQAEVEAVLVSHYRWATPRFMALAEDAYVVSPAPAVYDVAAAAADLLQRYGQQHDSLFAVGGPVIYEGVTVALEALQRAVEAGNLTCQAVRDEIAHTNQASSILGRPVAFETNGSLKGAQFYILQVDNGVFKIEED